VSHDPSHDSRSEGGGSRGARPLRSARLRADSLTVQSGISPSSMAAECYRSLAVRLEEQLQKAGESGYVLAVTSPEPAAGKTLTSLNLALSFARMRERRVLLLECDLRRPDMSSYLETDVDVPGLAQLLEQRAELTDAIVPIWGTGLDLVSAGTRGTVENLMADPKMARLLAEMRSQYEIVMLDSAPLLLASGQSTAGLADGVLLVARAGKTRKTDMEEALSTLAPSKVLGLVLNHVRPGRLVSPAYTTYGFYGPDRKSTHEAEEPFLGDLQLHETHVAGRDLPRRRRLRPFYWRVGLGVLILAVAAGLAALVWLRPPGGSTSPSTVSAPGSDQTEAIAPAAAGLAERTDSEREPAADEARPNPSALPATGWTMALTPMRQGPGTDHPVVTPLESGVEVLVEESDGDWLRVRMGDREGWVLADLIALEEESVPNDE
jgi:protein-tyrosine kinase